MNWIGCTCVTLIYSRCDSILRLFHEPVVSSALNMVAKVVAAGNPEQRRGQLLFEGLRVAGVRGLDGLAPISKVRSRSDRNRPWLLFLN
jgi:hypothetical protein